MPIQIRVNYPEKIKQRSEFNFQKLVVLKKLSHKLVLTEVKTLRQTFCRNHPVSIQMGVVK